MPDGRSSYRTKRMMNRVSYNLFVIIISKRPNIFSAGINLNLVYVTSKQTVEGKSSVCVMCLKL